MVANLLFVLKLDCSGASSRNRTGTPAINEAADFKSAVSTYSTIEALISKMQSVQAICYVIVKQKSPNNNTRWQGNSGGAGRSRTDLLGFAIRYITALLLRQKSSSYPSQNFTSDLDKKGKHELPFLNIGAGKESRTLDLNLGKVALYQLSYSRVSMKEL